MVRTKKINWIVNWFIKITWRENIRRIRFILAKSIIINGLRIEKEIRITGVKDAKLRLRINDKRANGRLE